MVCRDAWQLRQLVETLRADDLGGHLAPALAPHLAFYAVEARAWLHGNGPATGVFAALDEHLPSIKATREHLKLSAGRDDLVGLARLLTACESRSVAWFHRPHRGWLGRFKSLWQRDLGLCFLGSDLISTTHVGLANLVPEDLNALESAGEPFEEVRKASFARAEAAGRVVGAITTWVPQMAASAAGAPELTVCAQDLKDVDCKSVDYYAEVGRRTGLPSSNVPAFVFMACQVNLAERVLPALLSRTSDYLFRMRYLAAYSALEALRRIGHELRGELASPVGRVVKSVQASPSGRGFRKLGTKLRRDVAHYEIASLTVPSDGPAALSLRGLLDHHAPSVGEIDEQIAAILGTISTEARLLLQP